MNFLSEIKQRFTPALAELVDNPTDLLSMIVPAGDPKFGDYQANCAMPLSKRLGKKPREIADDLIKAVHLDDLCSNVEIAGPGFINLTLSDSVIKEQLNAAYVDDRLGVGHVQVPKTFVVDYSSPNVAKPMHVGHIRSTVIGAAIASVLRFAGHNVITDNHLGDWGTQFGMIIYGYKNFSDQDAYEASPVSELGRLYKLVRKIIDFHANTKKLPELEKSLEEQQVELETLKGVEPTGDKKVDKKQRQAVGKKSKAVEDLTETILSIKLKLAEINNDATLKQYADEHPDIGNAVLLETAALHAGDETNLKLWHEFLPACREDIQRVYRRLKVSFDHELGESFYHSQLGEVVNDLEAKGFTKESEGAKCVFLENYETPMIVQKKDGAYLYATTDLATIKYRVENWKADASLYVVDHRQGEHFNKLFDVAKLWGYNQTELYHVKFGTVLDKNKRPFKTREGDAAGLEGLLDKAEEKALSIVKENNPDLDDQAAKEIAKIVGIGGIKYADLAHNRTSDYVFDYDKMMNTKGNSSTYLQYAYARVFGIGRKLDADYQQLRSDPQPFEFKLPIERQLAVKLLQFGEAIDDVMVDYKPNILCSYLFETSQVFAQFFDQCSVKDAGSESLQRSRLQLCDLTARTLKLGLTLLGIDVLEKM